MIIYDEIEMINNNALRSFRGCTDTDVIVIEVAPSTKGQLRFHGAEVFRNTNLLQNSFHRTRILSWSIKTYRTSYED